jgi:hypothetical protein
VVIPKKNGGYGNTTWHHHPPVKTTTDTSMRKRKKKKRNSSGHRSSLYKGIHTHPQVLHIALGLCVGASSTEAASFLGHCQQHGGRGRPCSTSSIRSTGREKEGMVLG